MDKAKLIEYKCPCCGGMIEFDSKSQKMKCPYCDTEFDVDTLKGYDEALKTDRADDTERIRRDDKSWTAEERDSLRSYICKSCGGEIVTDAATAATSCPFCGNPVVMTGQFEDGLKPDMVIPFKHDKKAAKAALAKHLTGKIMLPRVFKDENHIDEIKGVYVPFWLYDADADANIRYKATKVRSWSDSDYDYTETSYFSLVRAGYLSFTDVPADGSSRMADDLMESIEPFDMSEAVDFRTAYLSGYFADRYDVSCADSRERAVSRMKTSVERSFADTADGYSSVNVENSSIQISDGRIRYALLPVWILNTNWKGEKYTFAMNGQTGKFVGNLPTDWGKFFLWLAGLTLSISALVLIILIIFGRM